MLNHNAKDLVLEKDIKTNKTQSKAKLNTEDEMYKLRNLEHFNGNSELIYDQQLLEYKLEHSAFAKRLKPDALQKLLGKQQKYLHLKTFAIKRLEEEICHQLNLPINVNHCHNSNEEPDEETSQQIFNWSLKEFLKRRNMQNCLWVDVMFKYPERCLQKYKFRKDLEELQKYVKYIFDGLLSNRADESFDVETEVITPINNLQHLLQMCHNMDGEYLENKSTLKELMQKHLVITNFKQNSEKRPTAIFLRTELSNSYIWDDIEKRYSQNWIQSQVNQNQYRVSNIQQNYERDIENYKSKALVENACSNNCMDYMYSAIEQLKTNINEIQLKFDTVSEEMENNLSYKRLQIDKLRDQREWLTSEIKRFHEEIEVMRMKQEREEKEIERLRVENEELAPQMIEDNKNKSKKKKGKKQIR